MYVVEIILGTIVALGILITVHEFGHFWVGRRCGIHVLRFSIGFGPALYKWVDRRKTEYVIAFIPLGGYVRFLDSAADEVPPEMEKYEYNRKPLWQRIAVVLAGPVANFILAIFLLWVSMLFGERGIAPVIGEVIDRSPAAIAGIKSGDEIIAIDDKRTPTWRAVSIQLANYIGSSGEIHVQVMPHGGSVMRRTQIPVYQFLSAARAPNPIHELGLRRYIPPVPPIIAAVESGSPADIAGLVLGDYLQSVNGEELPSWQDWVKYVRAHPNETMDVIVLRAVDSATIPMRQNSHEKLRAPHTLQVTPAAVHQNGATFGRVGVTVASPTYPPSMQRTQHYNIFSAFVAALQKCIDLLYMTINILGKMIVGDVALSNISGPVMIAKLAGDTFAAGFLIFINFMAFLSLSLGVINLLPIPVLDGGHLVFLLIEGMKGSPLSLRVRAFATQMGMALLFTLLLFTVYNDILHG